MKCFDSAHSKFVAFFREICTIKSNQIWSIIHYKFQRLRSHKIQAEWCWNFLLGSNLRILHSIMFETEISWVKYFAWYHIDTLLHTMYYFSPELDEWGGCGKRCGCVMRDADAFLMRMRDAGCGYPHSGWPYENLVRYVLSLKIHQDEPCLVWSFFGTGSW